MVELSSVDQDGQRQGKLAAKALFSRIGGRHLTGHTQIDPSPILRGSI
jgi:DNA-binding LacI/PurR family transcriptional regulator